MFINFSPSNIAQNSTMGIIVHGIWCLRGKKMKMKMLQHYTVVKAQTLTETRAILFVKKSAFRFTSCHAVFLVYLLYSLSQK